MKTYNFTLRQLQYVLAVAETMSFRRAAERCHVSQPSLSAQVAEMEAALSVSLFERDRRGVLITAAGKELIARARRVLVEADDLAEAAGQFTDPLAGTLRIGVIPTIGPYLLPRVVPALRKTYPRLTLIWIEDKTDALNRALKRGDLVAALLALEADLDNLDHQRIAVDPFVLAVPREHELSRGARPVTRNELRSERVLLLDDGHCFRDQVLDYCSDNKLEEMGFRATSLPTLTQMVSSGAGVTLLPTIAVPTETQRSQLSIRTLERPVPFRTIVLGWRRRSALADTLRKVAETLRVTVERDQEILRGPGAPREAGGQAAGAARSQE
ncbi:MAG: LysR substrate-binding domain-containing protein [Acidobacteria bacterium]|nr:LysR substrate-binding domain-containing protein [Acidobacteriota bacterium]